MEKFSLNNILNIERLNSEMELEQATSVYNRLRVNAQKNHKTRQLRNHLEKLIEAYENEHWDEATNISEEQIQKSDRAEMLIHFTERFINRRKILIQQQLQLESLKQKDLAYILGHRENYMSELLNGLRPFSQKDIIILNRLFKIDFKDLIVPVIKEDEAQRIRKTLKKLNTTSIKLDSTDLELSV